VKKEESEPEQTLTRANKVYGKKRRIETESEVKKQKTEQETEADYLWEYELKTTTKERRKPKHRSKDAKQKEKETDDTEDRADEEIEKMKNFFDDLDKQPLEEFFELRGKK